MFFLAALVGPAVFCTSFFAAADVGDLRLTALCWFDAVLVVVICVRLFAAVLGFAVNITCYQRLDAIGGPTSSSASAVVAAVFRMISRWSRNMCR